MPLLPVITVNHDGKRFSIPVFKARLSVSAASIWQLIYSSCKYWPCLVSSPFFCRAHSRRSNLSYTSFLPVAACSSRASLVEREDKDLKSLCQYLCTSLFSSGRPRTHSLISTTIIYLENPSWLSVLLLLFFVAAAAAAVMVAAAAAAAVMVAVADATAALIEMCCCCCCCCDSCCCCCYCCFRWNEMLWLNVKSTLERSGMMRINGWRSLFKTEGRRDREYRGAFSPHLWFFFFFFFFFNRCVKIATKLFVSCRCFRAGVDDGGSDDWGERGARGGGGGGGGSNKRKEMSVLSTYRPFIHDSLFLVDWWTTFLYTFQRAAFLKAQITDI